MTKEKLRICAYDVIVRTVLDALQRQPELKRRLVIDALEAAQSFYDMRICLEVAELLEV